MPQVEALVQCRLAVGDRVPLIADGGVKRDGSVAEAFLFGGDTVMLGSAFAGTEETPGETVLKPVLMPESQKIVRVPFKVFRGMASIGAVRDRLDLEDAGARELEALGAEGLEVSVPARGPVRAVIHDMLKHLCSAISYGGAESLADLRTKFWSNPEKYLVRLSRADTRSRKRAPTGSTEAKLLHEAVTNEHVFKPARLHGMSQAAFAKLQSSACKRPTARSGSTSG